MYETYIRVWLGGEGVQNRTKIEQNTGNDPVRLTLDVK